MTEPHRASHFVRQLDPSAGRAQSQILAELRRAILSGRVIPGSTISTDEVGALFGVSPIPVRESLKTLVGEGLVVHRPRAGYRVAALDSEEYEDLYVVCRALEIAAIPRALARATHSDDLLLRAAHERALTAMSSGDAIAYQAATKSFHFALIAPSGMSRLIEIIERTWNMTEPGQPMQHNDAERRAMLQREHADQLAAFLDRDEPRLVRQTLRHYDSLFAVIGALPPFTGTSSTSP